MKISYTTLRRQPQQKRGQERVEKILDAAASVFNEVGFEAATTHEIASRANTAVGSLYQFFPDKLAIFNALELRHVDRVYEMWDELLQPEIIQLPFNNFIQTIVNQFQRLFEQPTSRIIFMQFFTSPSIFRNIDISFTQEAIDFTAKLFRERNPSLTNKRSQLIAKIAVNGVNAILLIALHSEREEHRQEIYREIQELLKAYLKKDLGDEFINNQPIDLWHQITQKYQLNSRQIVLLKYIYNNDRLTINNCEAIFPHLSRRTLQRDLKGMVKQDILIPQGNTDQRYYQLNIKLRN